VWGTKQNAVERDETGKCDAKALDGGRSRQFVAAESPISLSSSSSPTTFVMVDLVKPRPRATSARDI
jgi:hypothetical protein